MLTRVVGGPTLHEAFDPKWNSLNALRLVFATAVIVSHAHLLGAFGPEPSFGGNTLGGWAVASFFVASGYLIAGSRVRSRMGSFMRRRSLRIFPGLWVCLLVIVVVFVPVAALEEGGTFPPAASAVASFLFLNAILIGNDDFGIDGTLETVPYPGSWDGSLWSLLYEFSCYIVVAVVLTGAVKRHPRLVIGVAFVGATLLHLIDVWVAPLPNERLSLMAALLTYFLAGSLIWAFAHRVPSNKWMGLGAVGLILLVGAFGQADALGALPLAYLCIWLAACLPLQRIGRVNDISYGVYIYAFPVQQLLVLYGGAEHGLLVFIALAVPLTFGLAALSWKLVEHPAMRWRSRAPARERPVMSSAPPEGEPALHVPEEDGLPVPVVERGSGALAASQPDV